MYLDELGRIRLSPSSERKKNIFNVDKKQFRLKRFVAGGGNSQVFEVEDVNRSFPNSAIKICRFPIDNSNRFASRRMDRFEREIDAIKQLNEANHAHIVRLHFDDRLTISGKVFRHYIMELAHFSLEEIIQSNRYGLQGRVELCLQVLQGLKELHGMGFYHRDIKPSNILFIDSLWKIGDLGLVARRDEDQGLDEPNEMIGPRGWLCPEATNKHLTQGRNVGFQYDCRIDELSDIFQLGKLFWFIFQCNVPIGQLKRGDFRHADNEIFQLLELMLQHEKQSRPNLDKITSAFDPIARTHAVV